MVEAVVRMLGVNYPKVEELVKDLIASFKVPLTSSHMNALLEGIKLGGATAMEVSKARKVGIGANAETIEGMSKGVIVAVCIKIKKDLDDEKAKKLVAAGL